MLNELETKFPEAGRGVLMGYLKHRDWKVSAPFEETCKADK